MTDSYTHLMLLRTTAEFDTQLIKKLSATPILHAQNELNGVEGRNDPQTALQANKATFFFRLVEFMLFLRPFIVGC